MLEIGEGVFEVKSTSGNTHLGGDDWDQRVIDWLVKTFKDTEGVDLSNDKMAIQRLKEAAEKAKIELSAVQETTINLPFITATSEGPKHLDLKLTRSKFQELTEDLVDACRGPFEQAINDAGLSNGRHRPRRAGRRLDAYAGDPGARARRSPARSRTRASTPTRSSPSARRSRPAC